MERMKAHSASPRRLRTAFLDAADGAGGRDALLAGPSIASLGLARGRRRARRRDRRLLERGRGGGGGGRQRRRGELVLFRLRRRNLRRGLAAARGTVALALFPEAFGGFFWVAVVEEELFADFEVAFSVHADAHDRVTEHDVWVAVYDAVLVGVVDEAEFIACARRVDFLVCARPLLTLISSTLLRSYKDVPTFVQIE